MLAGVMMWDASQAYGEHFLRTSFMKEFISVPVNNRFDLAAKNALVAAGGTGFTYPACSAPAYSSGTAYTAASQVTYNG